MYIPSKHLQLIHPNSYDYKFMFYAMSMFHFYVRNGMQ